MVWTTMKWRTAKKCSDCPFSNSGAGLRLRKSLSRKRWEGILDHLREYHHFFCHKTTIEGTGNGTNPLCAGSLQWQKKTIGDHGNLAQVMERLERKC
jgi:hypothetical protein